MIDQEMIDKLFSCMATFYGERWSSQFGRHYTEFVLKIVWKSALIGLDYEMIKAELVNQKRLAHLGNNPPDAQTFYLNARRRPTKPQVEPPPKTLGCSEVGKQTISEIRERLKNIHEKPVTAKELAPNSIQNPSEAIPEAKEEIVQ